MTELRRTIDLRRLTLMVVGTVIGSGIFIVPAQTLEFVGARLSVSLAIWTAGGVLSLLGALTYAEMGAMKPEAGGLYVYIRDTFGRRAAFLYGWVLFLVIAPATVAALATAAGAYAQEFVSLTPWATKLLSVGLILLMVVINSTGTRGSANVVGAATLLKAAMIVLLSIGLVAFGRGPAVAPADLPPATGLVGAGAAMIGVLWAYEGWQWITFSAGETIDPQRVVPRGLVLGTAFLVALYVLANVAYSTALGPIAASHSTRIAAEATTTVLGPFAGRLVAATIVLATVSAGNSVVLTTPRVFYAMSRDRLFFERFGRVHPGYGTPVNAIVASGVLAALFTITGTFNQLLTYVVFTAWIFYGLAAASLFLYRRQQPDAPRPFRVPGYPLTPALFVASAAGLVVHTIVTQPERAAVGLGALAVGLPVYEWWARRARTSAAILR